MPSGEVHDHAWSKGRLLALPLAVASALATDSVKMTLSCNSMICVSGQTVLAIGVLLGYAYGRYVTPDEDIVGMTVGEGLMMNHFPIVGNFFVAYWSLYGAFMRRHHRSFLTHGPIISTAIRYVFAFWWTGILVWKGWWGAWATYMLIGMFIGTCLIDTIHWWLDKTYGD